MKLPTNLNFTTFSIGQLRIPVSEFPPTSSWRWNFSGMNSRGVENFLCSELRRQEYGKFNVLIDYLLLMKPASLVRNVDDTWLRMVSLENGCSLYLSCRDSVVAINELMKSDNLAQEFHRLFSGLRTGVPSDAGSFLSHELITLMDVGRSDQKTGKWTSSMSLFHAATGDHLLLNEGEFAWYIFPEGKIKPIGMSFSKILKRFVEIHKLGKTFDSYSFY